MDAPLEYFIPDEFGFNSADEKVAYNVLKKNLMAE